MSAYYGYGNYEVYGYLSYYSDYDYTYGIQTITTLREGIEGGYAYSVKELGYGYYAHANYYALANGRHSYAQSIEYGGEYYGSSKGECYSEKTYSPNSYLLYAPGEYVYRANYLYLPPGSEYSSYGASDSYSEYSRNAYYGVNQSSTGYQFKEPAGVYYSRSFYTGPGGPTYYQYGYNYGGYVQFGY